MDTDSRQVVIASGNRGKILEIARLLKPLGLTVVPQRDLGIPAADETGSTFAENALLKARHAARLSGRPALADDSGLAVDALDGRPGVRSARYAGDHASDADNIARLLGELSGVAEADRGAAFHCAAVFVRSADDAAPIVAEGHWCGRILDTPGGSGGFGYDPVFLDVAAGKAAASMTPAEKNARSHRGQAFGALFERLRAELDASIGVEP